MLKVSGDNQNYLARVIRLPRPTKHPNADRLQVVVIDYNAVITDLKAQEGDIYVYFPLESTINLGYLSYTNSFSPKELNQDQNVKGYFPNSGRVRATNLRGQKSEGYIVPASTIEGWIKSSGIDISLGDYIGTEFDSIGDTVMCRKYVVRAPEQRSHGPRTKKDMRKIKKRVTRLIDKQFKLADDTLQLKKLIHEINPTDIISISHKLHGTNFSCGHVLCKKKLRWFDRFVKFMGVDVVTDKYDVIYASRTVVKNAYYTSEEYHGYYSEDIWKRAYERVGNKLKPGISIHAEIVGFLSNGKYIQKNYDYGCPPGEFEIFVYRMFYTSPHGDVIEFTTPQIISYCECYGLQTVPYIYYGYAGHVFNKVEQDENWHDNFLYALMNTYLEKPCHICKNEVPAEGIVVAKTVPRWASYKLKSFAFLKQETKMLDQGEINIDDM